ncbi:hypothetical protein Fmac_011701 [Flemingia macrophylla]|uniref:Uncharacterized protein n=1 Tax=Flemingia macrophylla TaxID=520843 RepID=A0ABD1MN73_9FABA
MATSSQHHKGRYVTQLQHHTGPCEDAKNNGDLMQFRNNINIYPPPSNSYFFPLSRSGHLTHKKHLKTAGMCEIISRKLILIEHCVKHMDMVMFECEDKPLEEESSSISDLSKDDLIKLVAEKE